MQALQTLRQRANVAGRGTVRATHCPALKRSFFSSAKGNQQPINGTIRIASTFNCKQGHWQLFAQDIGGFAHFEGSLVAASDHEFAVVVARFNDLVTARLLEGALAAFKRHGVDPERVTVAWVPGSFELPLVAKTMAKSGRFAAVVGIGAVIRGATTHYDAVVNGATSGLLGASTSTGVPVVFGVLTCDTMEQALDRAGGKAGNKGGEAAVTAIEMANLLAELLDSGRAAGPWQG